MPDLTVLVVLVCCYFVTLLILNLINIYNVLPSLGLFNKNHVEEAEEDYEYMESPDAYCVYDLESLDRRLKDLKEELAQTDEDGLYNVHVTPSPTKMTGVEIPVE